jgi:diguanylate cyclase (GGDEF)-like protein/PAS domain S-box-containing protein
MGASADVAQRVFEHAPDLLAIADRDGRLEACNPAWEALLRWTGPELAERTLLDLVHAEDAERVRGELASGAIGASFECRLGGRDGGWRWLLWTGRRVGEGWALVGKDITDRKELEHRALHDQLTGVVSRELAMDRLRAAVARLARSSGDAAMALVVDIDDLTSVNDTYGHHTGDAVLRAIADRLGQRLRAADTVGRIGGDRFLVVAEDVSDGPVHGIEAVIERVHSAFARPVPTRSGPVPVSASIGVAVARSRQADPEDLIRDADIAQRRAKRRGRGQAEVYDAALAAEVRQRLDLAAQLRGALQRGELFLVFQPLVALAEGTAIGYEALLRWRHPRHGELTPFSFLRIAEDDGLIVPIGAWVLEQACRQLASWRAEGRDLWMSVNVSASQLAQPDFVAVVERALHEAGVPPHMICLEVTETAVLRRPEIARYALEGLRRLGARVALDDFGLGYSSLAHLKELPVDVVKVDRSFVADLGCSPEDRAIVEAMLTLARRMGLSVIAEGVETREQDEALRALGCPTVQGYLYGRPVPAAEVPPPPAPAPPAIGQAMASSRP